MIKCDFQKKLNGGRGEFSLHFCGEIKKGERVGIFGASGSGKSTILRILSGLERPDCGEIIVDGVIWNQDDVFLPPQKRNLGFVFQNYALFPNLNVKENIAYGKGVVPKDVDQILELMELEELAHHRITNLSGGQAQRVAIARALVRKPKILLLDEPLSALDFRIKNKLLNEINHLQKELGFTLILVSHQISEIYRLSDRVFEIEEGQVISIKQTKEEFGRGKMVFTVEVLDICHSGFNARLEVLLDEEIISFVCHPNEIEGIGVGDYIKIAFKSFSPLIL